MWQKIIYSLALTTVAFAAPQQLLQLAETCNPSKCQLPICRCASTNPPEGLNISEIPQSVLFTFDDAVQVTNYDVYADIFYEKKNPDGCPVQSTYFVSHEYIDYSKVHDLYVHNQEIALHSISHEALTDYWKNISIAGLTHEFGDEKTLISYFANIPKDALKGMRLPFLQLSGDSTFEVAKSIGLTYDCSWPTDTFTSPGLWPYTLDYKSTQDCPIGPCPENPIPGLWVVPMIDWTDLNGIICSMVDGCVNIPDDNADHLLQWFIDNFNVQYKGNKAPFGFYVHSAYFNVNPVHLEAYKRFIDYLQGLKDVFLVSPSRAIEWIQNPVPISSSNWPPCPEKVDSKCQPLMCELMKEDDPNPKYMTFCSTDTNARCPAVYPWLENPLGEKKIKVWFALLSVLSITQ